MARRSPRFRSRMQDFPIEIVTTICVYLELPTWANVRLTSKAFKELAESDSVARALCIRQGFIEPTETLEQLNNPSEAVSSGHRTDAHLFSKLQRQGYTNEDLVSYWSLLRAKLRNRKGQSFCKAGTRPPPTIRRVFDCQGLITIKIDPIDRVIIGTTHCMYGGLVVVCIDTGAILWNDETIRESRYNLDYSEGYVVAKARPRDLYAFGDEYQVWHFDRLSPTLDGPPKRGILRRCSRFAPRRRIRWFRFRYPYFVALDSDQNLICMDVRSSNMINNNNTVVDTLIRDTHVRPFPEMRRPDHNWSSKSIEFDDEYFFSLFNNSLEPDDILCETACFEWSLQARSRETGEVVWHVLRDYAWRPAIWYEYQFDDKNGRKQLCQWQRPIKMVQRDQLPVGKVWTMQIDETTGSLCVCCCQGILVFPNYKKTIKQGGETSDLPIYLSIVREKPRDNNEWERKISVGGGLACFDILNGLYLVDLRAAIADRAKDAIIRLMRCEEVSSRDNTVHVNETMVAFMNASQVLREGNKVTLFDFAEIGRLASQNQKTKAEDIVLKLPRESVDEDESAKD